VAELLERIAARAREGGKKQKEYIHKLLSAFGKGADDEKDFHPASRSFILHPLVEPVSERELEILRLIAAGQSNKEIARTLIIAIGTVKKHLNNIYTKLGVRSRTQALAKARALKLL
jgi:LuxR family maltose regulon positive regulatory protein